MSGDASGLAVGLALVGYGLVALSHAAYAIYLWRTGLLKRPVGVSAFSFMAAVLATVAWGVTGLLDQWSTKILPWHLNLMFDQARYAAWVVFMLSLLRRPLDRSAAWRRWDAMALLALIVVGAGANLYLGAVADDSRLAVRLLVACQLGWSVLGLVLVEQLFRNQAESTRWGAKPLCLALGCLFAYDIYLYSQAMMFGVFDGDALGARGLVHAVTVVLLLMASRRHTRWLARVQVSSTAVFYSVSLLLIGLYLLFIAGAGYYVRFFGGTWGGALQVALLFIAMLGLTLLIFSGSLRARVRVFLSKHFLSYRYDYRLEWLRFTSMLSTKGGPQGVSALVVRGLADMVECPAGCLWFKALGDDRYMPSAAWNMAQPPVQEPVDSPFCAFIRERHWIVDVDAAHEGGLPAEEAAVIPAWLLKLESAWLAVPLLVADEMLGFVVLAQPRTPLELNWEVRDLLKTAARQAAGFLAQMNATEALLEARKFDAFNRMSAFVVHDLKNIITQLSLMMKNAERHRDKPEFQQDMLATVESSLDKMRQMMAQLREGERPTGIVAGVELTPILQRIAESAHQRGREIELEVVDPVATRGHELRLERVIGHVVQNAIDATPPGGRIRVQLLQKSGSALVVVEDTGVGMSADFIRTRLFRPFNSTKASGMGIGSYESFLYIRELGGHIDVQSDVGQGSVITISMPLFELRKASDLRPIVDA
ncbi:MAG: PEP-CTERM system histidine kinase PrsK [Burkholderiales bacterium]|nr:PEP-CTERM system histidine kinase PrsK [Burkholderiales bacterium]MDE1925706.1 PEP-CTERM system histidine kinase PrsK [Burkholderiales bacterium]MDE2161067.1 PEP-CTERM system histidine kinase PrsK [Burkholderiales bacterium]MDE2504185.1 PEP-CTERM system histidine kinase PrsK [Burkholderiales bacterium]